MKVITMPDNLLAELIKMRQNPEHFSVISMGNCGFCGGGTKRAYQLSSEQSKTVAGSWCPTHGWLHFDSVGYPPTEHLSDSEREDRRLARLRKRGPRATSDREENHV
jgi:hypothetical protein